MSASVGLAMKNNSPIKKKINKNAKEVNEAGETILLNAQIQEAFASSINKYEPISIATQTQADYRCCKDESHLYGEESFPPVPSPQSAPPLPSTSLPSLHKSYEYTNSKFCGSGLNLDSVCQESCSRREFNDSLLSINAVENNSHSSASACALSSSTLSSSSSLPLSSSSPSICCYTIASHSKTISKLSSRNNLYGQSSNSSHKHKFSRSLIEESFVSNNSCPSVVIGKSRTSAIPKSIRTKVSPPPVPPKPSKGKRNNTNKSKSHDRPYIKNQERKSSDQSYYDPASFRRKLQRFEKQNTLIGKSKNNVTRAPDKDEDDQGDERCEFLGCFSAGNNTNSDQSVSDISCVGSIKSVSVGGEKDYDIVYTEIRRSNNSTNNINNNSDAIDREHRSLLNDRECRVDCERKNSLGSGRKTLRYDHFGRLKSIENSPSYGNRSLSDIKLSRFVVEQPSFTSTPAVTLPSAVIIRKLTPKLSKQLHFRSEGITSRRCASDDSLILSCLPYAELQKSYDPLIEQRNKSLSNKCSNNISYYKTNGNSCFPDPVSASAPSVTEIENEINSSRDSNHQNQAERGRDNKIFKSLSDTNNANRSYELIGDRGNLNSIFHSTSITDVQDCILSELDINSSSYFGDKKSVVCKCCERKDFDETECCPLNNECMLERFLYYKIAHCNNPSYTDSRFKNQCEDNSTSSEISNLPIHIDKTDSLSANSSSSSPSQNFASPIVRGPLVLKRIPTIESLGYTQRNNEQAGFSKEIMMEKRRNTLDRWQRLGFGRRSSPSPGNQERTRKSSDKSERLKELTELLRRNRSSPTPPPVPPPRKPKISVSASSSIEKSNDPPLNILANQTDDILLMDQEEETMTNANLTLQASTESKKQSETTSNDLNKSNNALYEKLKPNTSLSNFESILSSRDLSKSPPPDKTRIDDDISTELSRPESRTVIGSYTGKGIPFRSASFSQIDSSSGKYIGAALNALRERLRRDKTTDNVAQADLNLSPLKSETTINKAANDDKTDENIIYIPLKRAEFNISLKSGESDDRGTPEVIPEEDYVTVEGEKGLEETVSSGENKNETEGNETQEGIVPKNIDEQIIEDVPNSIVHTDALDSNLATLVEEEIPLESPPDNFLQTATTCLIPVPVYECAAQEWNLENPPQEWVDVAPDEFGLYSEPVDSNSPVALEVTSRAENEVNVPTSRAENEHTVPTISVSQHSSTLLGEIGEITLEEDAVHKEIRPPRDHQESFEHSEVKKRYSHDDMEIGIERRSSLDCSLQRLCNNAEEKKRIDKSKRRKGMYIETDWVECPEVRESTGLHLQASLNNFGTVKIDQSDNCSSVMYLNSPAAEDSQTPGSLYSLDLNTPESECNRPPVWTKIGRRTSLSCQSSEERDEGILIPHESHKTQTFTCTESVSDNESDRAPMELRDRSSPSPALSDQDFKRYSKRPLRGPYGQMLEAEMKKPNRLHFEEILEELKDSDTLLVRRSRGGHHDTRSFEDHPRNVPQYSNSFRVRKSNTYLPIPTHARAASTPSQIENTVRTSGLSKGKSVEKRYQSTIDNSTNPDKKLYSNGKQSDGNPSRLMHKKSSSLVPLDKQIKRSMDEIRLSQSARSPSERSVLIEGNRKTSHGKDLMPTPELLAELLQGASEKLVAEQRQQVFADTRTHVVQEIFRNEQSYVESLQTVVLKYFKVLKAPEHAGMIDSRTVDEIFFMVPDILAIHEKFLSELKARLDAWEPQQKVGDAFIETFSKTEVLEVYTSFVNNCNRAKNAIRTTKQSRPSFARFLETTAREHKGKLTLDNLLIKPVQKFPNYEMLFTRLIKHTDGDHPDQKHLQEVLKLVHDILVHINCKEREILENGQREATLRELEGIIEGITELIAPDRQFLIFDLVSMPSGQGARKERGFFLFNDLLVITSIKRRSGTIRKPNTTSCPGSVASTLDTNKYKFLTKVSLDNLEIIKAKDENLRKIMNEIEQLADDCNKLQQIAEVTATIKYPHQILEDVIRDLHRDVQRQLSERQSNDAQLNMLELTVNSPNGSQQLSIIFSKSEKRSQWEEAFNEAKQKLAATLERHPIPEFMTSIPIVKTRAGLQFTCAAPTLSEQKDVWVCNSDGYVGQVCVMSLSPEPNVTSCNGVCNARILCLASVPACNESENKSQRSSLNDDTVVREFRKSSSPNFNTNQSEKKKSQSNVASSDIQLDSNSSSDDSEPESSLQRDRIPSPSPAYATGITTVHHHQHQDSNPDESDGNQSTMWLGTEDGYIHVYNCTDTIRIKKNKIKIQHASAVYSVLYLDNRVFVSLANGDICVYHRDSVGGWNTSSPLCISIGTVSSPVNKLLNVHGRLWCSIQGIIKVLDTKTLQVVNQIQISSDSKPITNMAVSSSYVWISIQNSAHIKCFHSNTHQLVTEVNLAPAVNKMLSNCDDIIRQHKAACLRVTSLLSCKDLIWIGTSAGVLLTIPAHGFEKGSPNVVPTGIPHGHTGHVRFLTFVETTAAKNSSSKLSDECASTDYKNRRSSKHSKTKSETGNILIISGGDGYEDFRNSGANSLSEIAGREDSTNHLLIWQI